MGLAWKEVGLDFWEIWGLGWASDVLFFRVQMVFYFIFLILFFIAVQDNAMVGDVGLPDLVGEWPQATARVGILDGCCGEWIEWEWIMDGLMDHANQSR